MPAKPRSVPASWIEVDDITAMWLDDVNAPVLGTHPIVPAFWAPPWAKLLCDEWPEDGWVEERWVGAARVVAQSVTRLGRGIDCEELVRACVAAMRLGGPQAVQELLDAH